MFEITHKFLGAFISLLKSNYDHLTLLSFTEISDDVIMNCWCNINDHNNKKLHTVVASPNVDKSKVQTNLAQLFGTQVDLAHKFG